MVRPILDLVVSIDEHFDNTTVAPIVHVWTMVGRIVVAFDESVEMRPQTLVEPMEHIDTMAYM